jgi:pimeloyl-ACP methyl ester carboxylesterase
MPSFTAPDGAVLAFDDYGRGEPPVVLVHGWQGTAETWGPLAGRLAERHRVVAVDLRGAGGSAGAPGPYSVERFAADVAGLAEHLGLERFVLAGHSMGGTVAQRLAVDHPGLLAALVLVAPVPASGLPLSPRVEAVFREVPLNPETARMWLGMLTATPLPADRYAILVRAAASVAPETALEAFDSWQRSAFEAEARSIDVPTLVLAGAKDRPQTPDFLQRTVVEVIAGARMTVVEDTGHFLHLERDGEVAALIEAFLASLTPD